MSKSAKKRAKELAKELEREARPSGPVQETISEPAPDTRMGGVAPIEGFAPAHEMPVIPQASPEQAKAKRSKNERNGKAVAEPDNTAPSPERASGRRPETGLKPARQHDTRAMALDLPRAELSDATSAYLAKCDEKIGFVPNVLLAYTHDDAKLSAFAALYNDLMLAPSGLSKLEREMIAVAVSAENRCYYCLAAHGAAVRQLSGDPVLGELMVMNYRAADLAPRHRAMLDFAVKLTRESYAVSESDREALRAVGFGERDIWDIGAVASFYNMTNRMASAVDMRPNPEYHAQAR